jgi:hypothetical protein
MASKTMPYPSKGEIENGKEISDGKEIATEFVTIAEDMAIQNNATIGELKLVSTEKWRFVVVAILSNMEEESGVVVNSRLIVYGNGNGAPEVHWSFGE